MAEIRFAGSEDTDTLTKMRLEMLSELGPREDGFVPDAAFVRHTRDYFARGDGVTVLAEEGGVTVGCVTLCFVRVMPTPSHPTGLRGHLMNVYVRKPFRRRGTARRILETVIEEARRRGATEIILDATDMARPLYAELGFAGSDEYMQLEL